MNMLKKGPELKLPEIKVPDFLLDLYYDLRERHLLPLVGTLVVAMVALPIVLSGSSDSEESGSEALAGPSSASPTGKLVVAKAAPGLREYRRRLAGKPATDPFKQQYATPEGEGGAASSAVSEVTSSSEESSSVTIESASSESTSTSPETTNTAPPSEGDSEPGGDQGLKYYSFAIDARIVPVSPGDSPDKAKPTIRRNLPELTMLPSRDTPALTFMSVSKDEKKVLMLVSNNVRGLFGDGVCVVGADTCQLIALEPGVPETVVYGGEERTFRIEVLKLRLVTTDRLDKAPLGKPKKTPDHPGQSG